MAGFAVEVTGSALVLFMPETLDKSGQEAAVFVSESPSVDDAPSVDDYPPDTRDRKMSAVQASVRQIRDTIESIGPLWKNVNVLLCISIFLVAAIGKQCTGLLVQYASAKFDRSMAWVRLRIK